MATMNGYQQYAESKVTTASKGKLLLMAYDGAIRFVRQAQGHMAAKRYEDQNTCILKTQRIILELISTLNRDANPQLAESLLSLYEYMYNQLVDANIYDKIDTLKEVEKLLVELRAAWEEADRRVTSSSVGSEMTRHTLFAAG